MKKYLLLIAFLVAFIAPSFAQAVEAVAEDSNFLIEFLSANYEAVAVITTWLVMRLIPTKWKDPVLMILNWLISLIPDKKSGGGSHEA